MSKQCVICGEQGFLYYPFCKKHLEMKNNGQIVKCEDCGKWHFANQPCNCKKEKPPIETESENKIKCLICKNDSNGMHFCKDCYNKYGSKTITVVIDKCISAEVVDEYGNRVVKTKNGLFVRSQQEKIIFDELYSRNLHIEYEKAFIYKDENGEIKTIHPDFYLPDYNLYIEHWGYESTKDNQYRKIKEYKERIYKK